MMMLIHLQECLILILIVRSLRHLIICRTKISVMRVLLLALTLALTPLSSPRVMTPVTTHKT